MARFLYIDSLCHYNPFLHFIQFWGDFHRKPIHVSGNNVSVLLMIAHIHCVASTTLASYPIST